MGWQQYEQGCVQAAGAGAPLQAAPLRAPPRRACSAEIHSARSCSVSACSVYVPSGLITLARAGVGGGQAALGTMQVWPQHARWCEGLAARGRLLSRPSPQGRPPHLKAQRTAGSSASILTVDVSSGSVFLGRTLLRNCSSESGLWL